jgi:2-methylcitrate dehydratase PrpD
MKSSESSIAESLARFVKAYSFEDLPGDVVAQAKLSILDCIGVAIRGSMQESTRIARDLILSCGGGSQSTLLGTGQQEAYAKLSLKKYRPMAARNEGKKVFSGLL